MDEQKEGFHYTYSAQQQMEIEAIRRKYAPDAPAEMPDKMEQLRRLDRAVTDKASTAAICVGVIFALVMGLGMSLIMTDLGEKIGLPQPLLIGCGIGVFGMVGVILAYPLYQRILRNGRKKAAPQILKLTQELSEPG